MDELKQQFSKLKVLVLGDVMLDKYYFTDVERISPEAPIPVARYNTEKNILGGAANVALNLAKLGVSTTLIGKIGTDKDGVIMRKLAEENNITLYPVLTPQKTISKVRILSRNHQLLRLDFEEKTQTLEDQSVQVIREIEHVLPQINMIIVSDYQKGLVSQKVIKYLKSLNKYISIDTKPGTFTSFPQFSFIKPNFKEAFGIARDLGNMNHFENSDTDVEKLGKFLHEKLKTPILITRSEEGVSYIGKEIVHSKTQVSNVSDVTGAGDTCIAVFSLLDYLGMDKKEALEIMNAAAKVTVSHLGTYSPTFEEIQNELYKEEFENVMSRKDLRIVLEKQKKQSKKIVFTNGCFDLLHKGHISYLNKAKELGDILVVGINSDQSVRKLKGDSRPLVEESSRAFVLSNLRCVDYVSIFDEDTPVELLDELRVDVHVKGGDYKKEDMPETTIVEKHGGKVIILPFVEGHSTTKLIEKSLKSH